MRVTPPKDLKADSIQGVIESLDRIVEWSQQNQLRTGYFAALYRKVTIRIQQGIINNEFDDPQRMEKFDVIFANRYLQAFESYFKQGRVTQVWKQAFDFGDKRLPTVLQHLMIGMNAHINFDLGIAAAQTMDGEDLAGLKSDFDKINTILASLVNEVQEDLARIWPAFKWIDYVAGDADEAFADKAMEIFRDRAWSFAQEYASSEYKTETIHNMDSRIFLLGKLISSPLPLLRLVLFIIRITERGSVPNKIASLE